jgi:hypothetical protein
MRRTFVLTGLGLLGLLGLAFLFVFHAALGQEKDTPDILQAIARMELSRVNVVRVKDNPRRLVTRTFSDLKAYLAQSNPAQPKLDPSAWEWVDQMGAMSIYRRGKERLMVSCGMYSRMYMICDLNRDP